MPRGRAAVREVVVDRPTNRTVLQFWWLKVWLPVRGGSSGDSSEGEPAESGSCKRENVRGHPV